MLLQAEKNRAAAAANNLQKGSSGPMRLYVGSLHFNITEEMLRGIFEPFGKVGIKFNLWWFQIYCSSIFIWCFCFKDRRNPADDGQWDRTIQRIRVYIGKKGFCSCKILNHELGLVLDFFVSLQMQNVQKKLWSSSTALSWLDAQWRSATWRSAQTHPRPAPSWTTMSWRGPASTWEPPDACSSWLAWLKVCSFEAKHERFIKKCKWEHLLLQELVWRSLLLPSRLCRWQDPCPSQPSEGRQVRVQLQ